MRPMQSSTTHRPTRRALRPLAAMLALTLAASSPGLAQESAINHIRPLMQRDHFAAVVEGLTLDRDQRQLATLMFEDYLTGVETLARRVDDAANMAGRLQLNEVFAGRVRMGNVELREMQADVLRTYLECGPEADRLLQGFTMGLEGIVRDEQKSALPAALRDLRRATLLHPYQIGQDTFTYAGDGVDVIELVAAGRREGGELADLDAPVIDEALSSYAVQLDHVLQNHAAARRDHELRLRLADVSGDPEARSTHEQKVLDAWRALYILNRDTVQLVGSIVLGAKGEWAQRLWQDRFDRACFSWMYAPRTPDRQLDWIRANVETPPIVQAAELAYNEYLGERDKLRKEAIGILVEARLERGVILHQLTSKRDIEAAAGDLYTDLLRNSGSLANLDTSHAAEIEALLDADQRLTMRRAVSQRR